LFFSFFAVFRPFIPPVYPRVIPVFFFRGIFSIFFRVCFCVFFLGEGVGEGVEKISKIKLIFLRYQRDFYFFKTPFVTLTNTSTDQFLASDHVLQRLFGPLKPRNAEASTRKGTCIAEKVANRFITNFAK